MKNRPLKKRFQIVYLAKFGRRFFYKYIGQQGYILDYGASQWERMPLGHSYQKEFLLSFGWIEFNENDFKQKFDKLPAF